MKDASCIKPRMPKGVRILGKRVREYRERLGLSQEQLARIASAAGGNVSQETIGRWERKENANANRGHARLVAEALKVKLEDILHQPKSSQK